MKQPLFPSTIGTQTRLAYFLTVKAVVTKFGKSDGQTGSRCLDKAVLAQRGGGGVTLANTQFLDWAKRKSMPRAQNAEMW